MKASSGGAGTNLRKSNAPTEQNGDSNSYGGRQNRANFPASNSIQGLHMDQQRSMNQSVDHGKASHSLSVNYPTANN